MAELYPPLNTIDFDYAAELVTDLRCSFASPITSVEHDGLHSTNNKVASHLVAQAMNALDNASHLLKLADLAEFPQGD